MKTFNQVVSDFQSITKDSSTATLALAKQWVNDCVHQILSMSDWNFNKDSKSFSSVAQQQDYDPPYNALKIDYVNVYFGNVWYVPQEVRSGDLWRQINNVVVYSDIPTQWYVSNRTRKISLFPISNSANQTIKIGFTKKVRDLSVADYTTGTVSTTANSTAIVGAGTTFTQRMIGSKIKITSASTVIGDMWFEINTYTDALHITVKESIPVAVAGASFTISEPIPFMEGFEDISLFFALEKYYRLREKFGVSNEYRAMWQDYIKDMEMRDLRSVQGILEQQTPVDLVDSNENPWCINIV